MVRSTFFFRTSSWAVVALTCLASEPVSDPGPSEQPMRNHEQCRYAESRRLLFAPIRKFTALRTAAARKGEALNCTVCPHASKAVGEDEGKVSQKEAEQARARGMAIVIWRGFGEALQRYWRVIFMKYYSVQEMVFIRATSCQFYSSERPGLACSVPDQACQLARQREQDADSEQLPGHVKLKPADSK